MDLKDFIRPRGMAVRLARSLQVPASSISAWASRKRPVPEEHAPAIEFQTGFEVRVESLCPRTRWQRVRDPLWPHGKPLIDRTPGPTPTALLAIPQHEPALSPPRIAETAPDC